MLQEIKTQAAQAAALLLDAAGLSDGALVAVGCSSSEIDGQAIGAGSSLEIAQAVFDAIAETLAARGVMLAAQCCEHLNRALIVERETARRLGLEIVNVVPQPKAGGSFATAAYRQFADPVAVENLRAQADAGMDIGGTLIGMHVRPVVVPVRLAVARIGHAGVVYARSRPKFVGGSRAQYDEKLL